MATHLIGYCSSSVPGPWSSPEPGVFSAGGDLKSGPARGAGPMAPAARLEHAQRVLLQLRSMPVPVIAAVEGGAIGIGWSLALSCDLVVAARDAFFSAPFVARGVVPDGGATWYLTERLGRHRASELLLLGGRLPAEEAHRIGLVNITSDPGRAMECAVQIATTIAGADRGTVEMSKRLLARAEDAPLDTFFALELATATIAQQSGTAAAARSSFTDP